MPVTLLNIILLAVMLVSALLGAGRGLLRVMVAVLSCAAALLVVGLIQEGSLTPSIEIGGIGGIVFLGMLIVMLILARRISHNVLASRLGLMDRLLGFLFGFVRGLISVTILFLFFVRRVPDRSQPEWVRSAKSHVVLQGTGDWLMSLLPKGDDEVHLIIALVAGSIAIGLPLSIGVDFVAIVTRWMGRDRER